MKPTLFRIVLVALFLLPGLSAPAHGETDVSNAAVYADIDGENLTFLVRFDITTHQKGQWVDVAVGDVVLDGVRSPGGGYTVVYDPERKAYRMGFASKGSRTVELTLAARPVPFGDTGWREAGFEMPASRVRELELTSDSLDLEVELLGAVRVKRRAEEGKLRITGVQGADRRFAVLWKPSVQELDAELAFATELNTIANVQIGALRLDTLIVYDVAQGHLDNLSIKTPKGLSITQVLGNDIRDWRIERTADDGPDILRVTLNRPQTGRYGLQVVGEASVRTFPTESGLPVIEPVGGTRAGGRLAVGTDSAISLVVKQAGGLSQIDAQAMPRIILDNDHARHIPTGKVFYYTFASTAYQLLLGLDHVEPTYDASLRVLVRAGQDEMRIEAQAELDVRDAPLRHVDITLPEGLTLVNVTGAQVDDYRIIAQEADVAEHVRVSFTEPVLGRVVLDLRLELGGSPLDGEQALAGFAVLGARSQRGFLVLASEQGVELGEITSDAKKLREINVASVPVRVEDARFAFRFGEPGWGLAFTPKRTSPSVRVEAFHLLSLGDGVAYGNVVLSYYITGSPIDELVFRIDPALRNVEFVGRDVRGARQDKDDPGRWTVKLQRRVIGDYNLAVTYSQPSPRGGLILAGGVRCADVESQSGYLAVASHHDLALDAQNPADAGLIELDREELPANYRLLVSAPMIACYRYTGQTEPMPIKVDAFDFGSLLPAVVEMTELRTHIAAQDNGEAESSTTVTFKVKNVSSQFLSLRLPQGAKVWSTRLEAGLGGNYEGNARIDDGGVAISQFKRIIVSHDEKTGELLIPLQRPRDPNTPLTIELVYGQVHGALGLSGVLSLEGPVGSVASTYESWRVTAPAGWAIHHVSGDLYPEPRAEHHGRIGRLLGSVAGSWGWAVKSALESIVTLFVLICAAIFMGIILVAARGAVLPAVVGVGLVLIVLLGITAANAPVFGGHIVQPDDLTTLEYHHVMSATDGEAVGMALRVTPAWRQYADVFSAVVVPAVGLLALGVAIFGRRYVKVLIAVGLVALLYGACRWPIMSMPVGHLLTWGLPVIFGVAFIGAVLVPRWRQSSLLRAAAVSATLLALASFPQVGCAATVEPTVSGNGVVLERVELDLLVEDDAMAGELRIEVDTAEPTRINLLQPGAILLSVEKSSDRLSLEPVDGRYELVVSRRGRYSATVRFLMPLPDVDGQRARSFRMPLPASLTNRVTLSIPGTAFDVDCPTAVRLNKQEAEDKTTLHAIIGHGGPVAFDWRPRARLRALEDTVFFAGTVGLVRFDTGMIEQTTLVRLDIAQGQLDTLTLKTPKGVSVTSVQGPDIGAWRFDPATNQIEAKLTRPATGPYNFLVVMQRAVTELPAEIELARLEVLGAQHQRGMIGLAHTPSVYTIVDSHPQAVNVDDFTREASSLIAPVAAQLSGGVRSAYRAGPEDVVAVTAHRVRSELRTVENASFTISDERLVYNGTFTLQITKAGRFSIDLAIPDGYDIDALSAAQVSHWDETDTDAGRVVTLHFLARTTGQVNLALALSRSISALPETLESPRVRAVDALKHTGQLIVSSEQGVRVAVTGRTGISEFDPAELGVRTPGALAFRLLRPGWSLTLNTELIDPVIDARVLHTAHVMQGVVRHHCYIRHNIRHAGTKLFRVRLPGSAMGVVITGSEVARISQPDADDPQLYVVELTRKQFARPYQLSLRYETPITGDEQGVTIEPVTIPDTERQRGYVTVTAGPRVELSRAGTSQAMQPAEARTIPRDFGAGDLSDAALCFSTNSEEYRLDLSIIHHGSADLLDANVRSVDISSVITEAGASINRVQLELNVGGKRHLQARLPAGVRVWSLLVGARSVVPSVREDGGETVYMIPLAPDASGDLPVQIDLVYATSEGVTGSTRWTDLQGPRFDLPLHNVNWTVYAPPGLAYSDFGGTLGYVEPDADTAEVARFTAGAYQKQVQRLNVTNLAKALDLQEMGDALAAKGNQRGARQALESAWFYSLSDPALNEDARVQLHRLAEEQALVGLVGSRGRLRQQSGAQQKQGQDESYGENFDREQARRLRNALGKADSENLQAIIGRMIETQDAATAASVPLLVNLPVRGMPLRFSRSIQVNPNTPMRVTFDADPPIIRRVNNDLTWSVIMFLVLLIVLSASTTAGRLLGKARIGPMSSGA
jgi:hypothetical protein